MDRHTEVLRADVTRAMVRLGIPMGAQGWEYLREAILLRCGKAMEERELYACVAEKYGVGTAAVQRGCRSAVVRAYDSGRAQLTDGFFPGGKRLSAAGFIAQCAEALTDGRL